MLQVRPEVKRALEQQANRDFLRDDVFPWLKRNLRRLSFSYFDPVELPCGTVMCLGGHYAMMRYGDELSTVIGSDKGPDEVYRWLANEFGIEVEGAQFLFGSKHVGSKRSDLREREWHFVRLCVREDAKLAALL